MKKLTQLVLIISVLLGLGVSYVALAASCNPNGSFYSSFTSTSRDSTIGTSFPVQSGETFTFTAQAETTSSPYQVTIGLMLTTANGVNDWIPTEYINPSSSWQTLGGSVVVPSGYVSAVVWVQQNGFTNTSGVSPSWGPFYPWYFQNINITYATQYPACADSWIIGSWTPADNCSASVTQTRSVQCESSSGQVVDSANCTAPEPATTRTAADYSGCQYSWNTGSWGSCTGGSGTWAYTAWSPTAGTYCTSALNQTRTGTCSITTGSGAQTRTVTCLRSDGTTVASSYCSNTQAEPATSQACTPTSVNCGTEAALSRTEPDYGGCTYSWQASGFGACVGGTGTWNYTAWTPTCGIGTFTQTRSGTCNPNAGSATQTQTVSCQRSDGTTVADTYCSTSTEPALSQACTPSSGYSCGTEAALNQSVTMNSVCAAALTNCAPNAAKQQYCVLVPDE